MDSASDPNHSIDRFAELSAEVDDLFADRAAVLAHAGLDDAAWMRLNEHWLVAFREPEGDHRAARFAEVFARTKARLVAGSSEAFAAAEAIPGERRFLSVEAQPWRTEAAEVGNAPASSPPPTAAPSRAQAIAVTPTAVATAYQAAAAGSAGAHLLVEVARVEPPPLSSAPPRPAPAVPPPLTGTLDASAGAVFGQALPFVAPPADDLKGTLPLGARADEVWPFPHREPPEP